jgi:hypothetical protein
VNSETEREAVSGRSSFSLGRYNSISMQEFSVDFVISSDSISLAEISEIVGLRGDDDSQEIGSSNPIGEIREHSAFKVGSGVVKTGSLEDHFYSIFRQLDFEKLNLDKLPQDTLVYFDVAIFYDEFSGNFYLNKDILSQLNQYGIELEISCYPCHFSESDGEEPA